MVSPRADRDETIFALASGPGRGGVAVVRISGPDAARALSALAGRLPEPRRATRARLVEPSAAEPLDDALILWFPAPASFTGEDVAELHLHGGPAVITGVLRALADLPGFRPADPGEFTRRAVLAGKMDLTAAEALADLIAAETEAQRRQALRQGEGALAKLVDGWRGRVVRLLAHVEAAIDFADEDDIPADLMTKARREASVLAADLALALADDGGGVRLRQGFHVVIVGAPNVGKSSLLNRLARRDAAIVSDRPGTTRDVIEVHLDLEGWPVVVADTAGLREADDEIERIGIDRARARADNADLVIALVDALDPDVTAFGDLPRDRTVTVVNKTDLAPMPDLPRALAVSARTGEGVDRLCRELVRMIETRWSGAGQAALSRERHRREVALSLEALHRFGDDVGLTADLAAEELRLAAQALGRITGRVDVEELLDVIFAEFCIGK